MTKDLIKLLIIEYQAYVTQVELVHRDVELMDGLNYVFVGLRHAGKSYLMYQRIAQLLEQGHKREEILYFNFEDDRIDSLDVTDLDLIKTCYEEMYDSRPIFFLDEVQLVDRWEKFARRLADQKYQVYITGSNAKMLSVFMETHNMQNVLRMQQAIIEEYKVDMLKYAPQADKSRIRECFESIPRQLSKENKKFAYATVRPNGRGRDYQGSLQWIEDAGIIRRCYNLSAPELPLDGNSIPDQFKVYMADTGLFISMLEPGTAADILQGNLYGYKGAIFENLVADIFGKMNRKLYYFRKDSGLEIDFVTRYEGKCILVEVKASNGNIKSAKTILSNPEKYHVSQAIKLGDVNVGTAPQTLILPLYMAFLLKNK